MGFLNGFRRCCLTPRVAGTLVWLLVISVSIVWFSNYQKTPGATGSMPARWPNGTTLPRNQLGPTIVIFLHPKCPCSKASLRQLFDFTSHIESLEIVTVLVLPDGTDKAFAQGPVMAVLEQEHHYRPILDAAGKEAAIFGAQTSGQALAYNHDGRLLFSGGLTSTRGHVGYSASILALLKALQDSRPAPGSYPVFGCQLQNFLPQVEN